MSNVKKNGKITISFEIDAKYYQLLKDAQKNYKVNTGKHFSIASLVEHIAIGGTSAEYLYKIGFIDYSDFMSGVLFHQKSKDNKYPRAKNLRGLK